MSVGSPSEAWTIFHQFYSMDIGSSNFNLSKHPGEKSSEDLSKGGALRSYFLGIGCTFTDHEAKQLEACVAIHDVRGRDAMSWCLRGQ